MPNGRMGQKMIGVFDSGIGGLTVVRSIMDQLPDEPIVYLGDTARTPYGNKSSDTIIKYSLNNVEFLLRQGADVIVIACNTASSHAYAAISSHYGLPVFEVIGPGAQLAVERSRKMRIGVIGTRATIASGAYVRHIKALCPQASVFAAPSPLLVPLVEEGWQNKPETAMIVRKYLRPMKNRQIDTLILGCTHYPVLRNVIQRKMGANVALVDSAEAVAAKVAQHLRDEGRKCLSHGKAGQCQCRIYVTDIADQFQITARRILQRPLDIEHADIEF